MEQQLPWAQSPHTVFPLLAPQDPSVVTAAEAVLEGAEDEEAGTMTGSPVVVVDVPLDCALLTTEDAAVEPTVEDATDEDEDASVQPDTQPFETRQWASLFPQ